MSKKYVIVVNEKYVLDHCEAFPHGCTIVTSFHFPFKVQSSISLFVLFFLIAETQYFLEGNPGVLIMICRDARIELD